MQSCLCDGTIADPLFNIIIQQEDQKNIKNKAIDALNISVATAEDVDRALAVFKKPLENRTVKEFHRALVALSGLSQINRLSSKMLYVHDNLITVLKKIIEGRGQIAEDRVQLIRSCLSAITNTIINNNDASACENVILQLLQFSQSTSFKAVVDRQVRQPGNRNSADSPNSLVDLMNCIATIGRSGKLEQLSSTRILMEKTTAIMRSFLDSPRIQTACFDVLTTVAHNNPKGVELLFSSGSMKLVVQYMQKSIMFEDVQKAGLKLWSAALATSQSDNNVDALKKAGAVDALQAILRVHPNSASLRAELAPLYSALISTDAVEGDINAANNSLNQAILVSLL